MVPQIEPMSVAPARSVNNLGEGSKISNSCVAWTKRQLKEDVAPQLADAATCT